MVNYRALLPLILIACAGCRTITWLTAKNRNDANLYYRTNGNIIGIGLGLRSDGVVVWRVNDGRKY